MKDQNKTKDRRIDELMELRQRIAELEKLETERRETEKSLKETEERYRELFDEAPVGYHEYDQEGRITNVNRTDLEMLGYPRKEMIGQFIWKFHVEEEVAHQQILAKLSGALPPGRNLERTYRRKDGTTFSALFEDRLIRDEKGQIKGIRCTIQDFTERKQMEEALEKARNELEERVIERTSQLAQKIEVRKRAEEALQESEERYRTILNSIEDGYFEVDIAGNFTFFNDSQCRILGYSRDEMMGMNNRQYMDKESAQKVYQVFNRIYTTGEPYRSFDWKIIRKDGTRRYIESSVSLKRNSKDERIGFRGTDRDITERKQAEETLQESEKRYYDLFKNANDIIYTHDLVGNFTSINRAAERVSGYTKEEALALNISEIIAPEYLKPILEVLGSESLGKGPLIHELEIITKEGRRVPLELSTRLIFKKQKPIGVEGIARDITERKKLEEERETLIKELQEALAKVKMLSGFIPICASCKKIRDDKGYWNQIESYIRDHSEAEFTHSICPECLKKLYPDFAEDKK